MNMVAPVNFQTKGTADFALLVGISLILADVLGTIIRCLTTRLKAVDSIQRLHDFLLKPENKDSRVCAPRLLGVVDDSAATTSRSERRRRRDPQRAALSQFVVQFIDVSVTFDKDEPVLQEVCFRIPRGGTTMFFGAVGCGKSTIMKLLIGQLRPSSGSILVAATSMAYCAQLPWIRNITILENIVGDYPLDRPWLRLVLYVCALDIDLARLPDGERTIAGSGGCNLSGGQQQRIVSQKEAWFSLINLPAN